MILAGVKAGLAFGVVAASTLVYSLGLPMDQVSYTFTEGRKFGWRVFRGVRRRLQTSRP